MGTPFMEIKRYVVAARTFDEVAAEVDAAAAFDGETQKLDVYKRQVVGGMVDSERFG